MRAMRKDLRSLRNFTTGVTRVQSVIPAEAGIQVSVGGLRHCSAEASRRDEGVDGYRLSPVWRTTSIRTLVAASPR